MGKYILDEERLKSVEEIISESLKALRNAPLKRAEAKMPCALCA